eukprot:m.27782 g.27782  ORF g.27782 m.27782 type:complete len:531 (-) comp7937_c0_seq2:74-1666(-)
MAYESDEEFPKLSDEKEPNYDDDDEYDDSNQHIKYGSIVVGSSDGHFHFSWHQLWKFTGPGFLMSIAYLDPGNIESDLQAGAITGYSLLWVLWWSTVLGLFLQLLSARLGVVTGRNLAEICRREYSTPVRITLWIMMEIAIISSDIQEVIGTAMAIRILSNGRIKLWQGALITGVDSFTFLLLERYGLRKLEAFFGMLITTLSVTFGVIYFSNLPPTGEVVKGIIVPEVQNNDAVEQATGILGAVIMPHNLYLHSALVLSRKLGDSSASKREANFYNVIESSIALFISFLVNLFVLGSFAHQFANQNGTAPEFAQCNSDDQFVCAADQINLLNAGCCLGARLGTWLKYVWAIGLLAAGQSSTMTGTYAGQFVMEGFLRLKVAPWKRVLLTRSVAMIPTVLVAVFTNPRDLGNLNEWMNVLQSVQLPFAMLPLMHFTSRSSIMGEFVNGWITTSAAWIFSVAIIAINLFQVYDISLPKEWYALGSVILVSVIYLSFVGYLFIGPMFPTFFKSYSNWYMRDSSEEKSPLLTN